MFKHKKKQYALLAITSLVVGYTLHVIEDHTYSLSSFAMFVLYWFGGWFVVTVFSIVVGAAIAATDDGIANPNSVSEIDCTARDLPAEKKRDALIEQSNTDRILLHIWVVLLTIGLVVLLFGKGSIYSIDR